MKPHEYDGRKPEPPYKTIDEAQTELLVQIVLLAMNKSFTLGEIHWRQSDSPYISQNKKSKETLESFNALRIETLEDIKRLF